MNERITEGIVRDRFKNDPLSSRIKIEEQKSNNIHIANLLKNASKSGAGHGYPEFIISFPDGNSNCLIIVECKASRKAHESKNRNDPANFAVDGALHYAKSLSKEFNVIAIAVSGSHNDDLDIANFLFYKNAPYEEIKNKDLLTIYDYSKLFREKEFLDNLITTDIVEKAVVLNKQFQNYSITELHRCTMVSAILVSLMDDAFRRGYESQSNTTHLSKFLLQATERELDKAKVRNVDAMINEYKTILNQPLFNQNQFENRQSIEVAKEIIKYLHKNIYPLAEMEDMGFDILGRFYREFVRYAGDQASQGLVLTPSHITNFFCDLANITKESIIYDPCCGTGGFLVSAMKYMLGLASADNIKRNKIKNEQLIGVEKRPEMFTYACSNMIMRGDGKSNIYYGDCFNVANDIKKNHKPNIAFLNPPYDKGNVDQMKFVEHALDIVRPQNGIVIAILQMSCATKKETELLSIKKSILGQHHLKAALSMPNELFYPVGVITIIMVFQSNIPNQGRPTWFGYFKEDGYEKRKHKGRIDVKNRWNTIRNKWLSSYQNLIEIAGLSIKKEITYKDEWCAEAYMETDYSQLTDKDFEKVLKNYVAFQFLKE
ncbi:MAG: HsdM family class I SAM-dependent methyltransferase [Alphaproteobacteria bacterium]